MSVAEGYPLLRLIPFQLAYHLPSCYAGPAMISSPIKLFHVSLICFAALTVAESLRWTSFVFLAG